MDVQYKMRYYSTLAGILRKTVAQLIQETGIQEREEATIPKIETLYAKANYPGKMLHFFEAKDLENYLIRALKKISPDLIIKLPLCYVGKVPYEADVLHVVKVKAWMNKSKKMEYNLIDFQNNERRFSLSEYPSYRCLWLYETKLRYHILQTC